MEISDMKTDPTDALLHKIARIRDESLGGLADRPAARKLFTAVTMLPAEPARRSQSGRRFAVAAVAAVAATAAVAMGGVAVMHTTGTGPDGRPSTTVSTAPAPPVTNVAYVLDHAAAAAEARQFTLPRPDQWIYFENRTTGSVIPGGVATGGPYETHTDVSWVRPDDSQSAGFDKHGRLRISGKLTSIPPSDYATLAAMPTQPQALLDWVYQRANAVGPARPSGEERYAQEFRVLNGILRDKLLPPKVEAAIFRAIKIIPGVTLVRGAKDGDGRPALAVGRVSEGWLQEQILLDAKTYQYMGERSIAIKDVTLPKPDDGPAPHIKKGTLQVIVVRLAAGIVDKPGQRPS
jgi:hypothetical protein